MNMKKFSAVAAFFRLVRWPNLLFITLTQFLFYYCIILPSFNFGNPVKQNILQLQDFLLLSLSSVLIAAAGYIINDYFDLNIDRINKPDKIVVEKIIKTTVGHYLALGIVGNRHSDRILSFMETQEYLSRSDQFTLRIIALAVQHHIQKEITDW